MNASLSYPTFLIAAILAVGCASSPQPTGDDTSTSSEQTETEPDATSDDTATEEDGESATDQDSGMTSEAERDAIRRTVRQHRDEVAECYEQRLRENPDLEGMITISWLVDPDGEVAQSRVVDSELDDEQVGECIADRILDWTFPELAGEGLTRVTYPFNFSAGDDTESNIDGKVVRSYIPAQTIPAAIHIPATRWSTTVSLQARTSWRLSK